MRTPDVPLLRIVRMSFQPDLLPEFLALFQETKPKIASMPGCICVELKHDIALPHVLYTLSHWQSEAHLNSYRHSALFVETWTKTKAMFQDKAQAYSLVNPIS